MANVVVGAEPAAQAEAAATQSVSVAERLGLTVQSEAVDVTADLNRLEDLVVSRGSREAAETAAQQAQAAADRAELERQKAEQRAKARAAAQAAAEAAAKEAAAAEAAQQEASLPEVEEVEEVAGPAGTAVTAIANITNSSGAVSAQTQAAADAVVSNVPGAAGITLGGTRPSATDPGGHPSGLALDYMALADTALGNAIVQYHIANWDALGVEYLIYQRRYLASPGGSWSYMEDRGSVTQNHMDHVHVNYRG